MKKIMALCVLAGVLFAAASAQADPEFLAKLTLIVDPADQFVKPGDVVTVRVYVSNICSALHKRINGAQLYIGYDPLLFEPIGVDVGDAPWDTLVYGAWGTPAPAPNGSYNELLGAVGIWATGSVGTDQPGNIAYLRFTAKNAPCSTSLIRFLPDVSDVKSTLLSDINSNLIVPEKAYQGIIKLDPDPPVATDMTIGVSPLCNDLWANQNVLTVTFGGGQTDDCSGFQQYCLVVDGKIVARGITSPYTLNVANMVELTGPEYFGTTPEVTPAIPLPADCLAHSICIRAYDMAANYSELCKEVRFDRTAPTEVTVAVTEPVCFAHPDKLWFNKNTLKIEFSSDPSCSGLEKYSVKLDGTEVAANATSPYMLDVSSLADCVEHNVTVVATDKACNSTESAPAKFWLDRTAPTSVTLAIQDVSCSVVAEKWFNKNSLKINFGADLTCSGLEKYCVKVDGTEVWCGTATTYDVNVTALADCVEHNIVVTAWDRACNSTDSAPAKFWLDRTVPTAVVVNITETRCFPGGDKWFNLNQLGKNTLKIEFSANFACSGKQKYQVYVDGTKVADDVTSPYELPVASYTECAPHAVVVRACDNACNCMDSQPDFFFLDNTAPTDVWVNIVESTCFPPVAPETQWWFNKNAIAIEFGANFDCSGKQEFRVKVDGTTVYTGTNNSYTLDVTALTDCDKHTVTVEAWDKACGMTTSAGKDFYLDRTAPTAVSVAINETTCSRTTDKWFNLTALKLNLAANFDCSGKEKYCVKVDGKEIECVTTETYTLDVACLDDCVAHNVTVVAWDNACNSTESAPVTFYLDRTAPSNVVVTIDEVTCSLDETKWFNKNTLNLDFSAVYSCSGRKEVCVMLDATQVACLADANTYDLDVTALADCAEHSVSVIAKDNACSATESVPVKFRLDRTAPAKPTITIVDASCSIVTGEKWFNKNSLNLSFAGNFDCSGKQKWCVKVDGTQVWCGVNDTYSLDVTALADCVEHSVTVSAYDQACNGPVESDAEKFWLDRSVPTAVTVKITEAECVAHTPKWFNKNALAIEYTANFDCSGWEKFQVFVDGAVTPVYVDPGPAVRGAGLVTRTYTLDVTALADCVRHEVTVRACDNACNCMDSAPAEFFLDRTAPTAVWVNITEPTCFPPVAPETQLWFNKNAIAIAFGANFDCSGREEVCVKVDGTQVACLATANAYVVDVTALADCVEHSITVVATDKACNSTESAAAKFWLDRTAPTAVKVTITETTCFPPVAPETKLWFNKNALALALEANFDCSGKEKYCVKVDGKEVWCGTSETYTLDVACYDDCVEHNVTVVAWDNACNSTESAPVPFWLDRTAPTDVWVNITEVPCFPHADMLWFNTNKVKIDFGANFACSDREKVCVKVDGVEVGCVPVAGTYDIDVTAMADCVAHNVTVVAWDNACNSTESMAKTFYLDRTNPTDVSVAVVEPVCFPHPDKKWFNKNLIEIEYKANFDCSKWEKFEVFVDGLTPPVYVDSAPNALWTDLPAGLVTRRYMLDVTALADCVEHNVTVKAWDRACGSTLSAPAPFWLDRTSPTDVTVKITTPMCFPPRDIVGPAPWPNPPPTGTYWTNKDVLAIEYTANFDCSLMEKFEVYLNGVLIHTDPSPEPPPAGLVTMTFDNVNIASLPACTEHRITVKAWDRACNSTVSAPAKFWIDRTPPAITITAATQNAGNRNLLHPDFRNAVQTLSPVTFLCLDPGKNPPPYNNPKYGGNPTYGPVRIVVKAWDIGNAICRSGIPLKNWDKTDYVPKVVVTTFCGPSTDITSSGVVVEDDPIDGQRTYEYSFVVDQATCNGLATIVASVFDVACNGGPKKGPLDMNYSETSKQFYVNKWQIEGEVQLEDLKPISGRDIVTVTFKATIFDTLIKTWNLDIQFLVEDPIPPARRDTRSYCLVDVPDGVDTIMKLSAKTNWALRCRLAVPFDPDPLLPKNRQAVVNFTVDSKLRGGDVVPSNSVQVADWAKLTSTWFTTGSEADINRDGVVNMFDYTIMKRNWFKTGDLE